MILHVVSGPGQKPPYVRCTGRGGNPEGEHQGADGEEQPPDGEEHPARAGEQYTAERRGPRDISTACQLVLHHTAAAAATTSTHIVFLE